MIENDTIRLLRECSSGAEMGARSIGDILDKVEDRQLKSILISSRDTHKKIEHETKALLNSYGDQTKDPPAFAKMMSKFTTDMKTAFDPGDDKAADLITQGCNMGVKTLNKYLNDFKAADERSKNIAKQLITEEERLCEDIKGYL